MKTKSNNNAIELMIHSSNVIHKPHIRENLYKIYRFKLN